MRAVETLLRYEAASFSLVSFDLKRTLSFLCLLSLRSFNLNDHNFT